MNNNFDLTSIGGMLTFAAATGIITALLNQVFGIIRNLIGSWQRRKSLASYHALRLAIILEAYAYDCADLIAYNSNAPEPPDEPYPAWKIKLPELPEYPEEADGWHALDFDFSARALGLRNKITGSQGVISSTAEYVEDELGDTVDEHAAERGLEALSIATKLRCHYSLPAFDPVWDFRNSLEQARKYAAGAKDERAKKQAEMLKGLNECSSPTIG